MDIKIKAKIGILGITILLASAPSFIKIALIELQEFNLIAFRFVSAFILLLILFHKKIMSAGKELYKNAFFLSMVLFLAFVTMTFGVRFTTASKAGFLTCLSVIFVPFLTYFIFDRKLDLRIVVGTAITIIGVGFLTLKGNLSMNLGDLLCMISSMLYGLHIIITERYASKCDPIALTVVQMGLVGVYASLVSFLIEKPHLPISSFSWISVVVLALFCTAVAFLVQTVSQKHISSEDVAIINAMGPLFAVMFAVILLHEPMNIREVFGCILLLMGVIVTQLNIFGEPWIKE